MSVFPGKVWYETPHVVVAIIALTLACLNCPRCLFIRALIACTLRCVRNHILRICTVAEKTYRNFAVFEYFQHYKQMSHKVNSGRLVMCNPCSWFLAE